MSNECIESIILEAVRDRCNHFNWWQFRNGFCFTIGTKSASSYFQFSLIRVCLSTHSFNCTTIGHTSGAYFDTVLCNSIQ